MAIVHLYHSTLVLPFIVPQASDTTTGGPLILVFLLSGEWCLIDAMMAIALAAASAHDDLHVARNLIHLVRKASRRQVLYSLFSGPQFVSRQFPLFNANCDSSTQGHEVQGKFQSLA